MIHNIPRGLHLLLSTQIYFPPQLLWHGASGCVFKVLCTQYATNCTILTTQTYRLQDTNHAYFLFVTVGPNYKYGPALISLIMIVGIVFTLTHHQNQVRGHKTGFSNSNTSQASPDQNTRTIAGPRTVPGERGSL